MERHAILPLDPQIIGKIAAGEVVERPALAIKELIENSIDAGATSITIQIRDGGLSYFRITDNGCGIDPSDIKMAFSRHATSKIKAEQDLFAIYTLGFRGEALHSIAAVSKVEIVTRRQGLPHGTKAIVEGGIICSIQDAPSPEGTSITVRDLFFNTPVRKKFVKKPTTEAGLVSDMVMRLIIARPDISFRLQNEERKVFHSPGSGKLRDALLTILGPGDLSRICEVNGVTAGCEITGFVGVGELAKSNRTMQTFILNGRYVRNGFLSQALEEGCRESVMVGKYPICALHLKMPYEAIDVNVHPNKLEVRFSDERALFLGISNTIRSALLTDPIASSPSFELDSAPNEKSQNQPRQSQVKQTSIIQSDSPIPNPASRLHSNFMATIVESSRPAATLSDSANSVSSTYRSSMLLAPDLITTSATQSDQPTQQDFVQESNYAPLKIIGVAWLAYIIVEMKDVLYFIDQHAAHERILFERFKKSLDNDTASQVLLSPQNVRLTHREYSVVLDCMENLAACGFDIEDFGDRTIQVRALPMVLGVVQMKGFFQEFAERISEYQSASTADQRRNMLIQMACKKAVKTGDSLATESIEELIRMIRETGTPPTCPHGRPIIIRIAKTDIDRRFRRI